MSRRLLTTLVVGAAVTALAAACSEPRPSTVQNQVGAGVEASAAANDLGLGHPTAALCNGKTYTIGYDVFSDTQEFAAAMTKNMQQVADQLGCVKIITLTDNADPATALANVKTFVERKVDGVVLFQVIASAQAGLMDTLNAAHIPALAVAVPAPGAPFMSISDKEAGKLAGTNLADTLVGSARSRPAASRSSTGRPVSSTDCVPRSLASTTSASSRSTSAPPPTPATRPSRTSSASCPRARRSW
jgi:ABC-type sugar transport system substrate-binding protein